MSNSAFVIICAFNEASVIVSTVLAVKKLNYSVVVVDDGSTDGTWAQIVNLPVYRLQHPINLGQGAALQTGMSFALQQNAEFLVHFDADGQHQAKDIEALLAPLRRGEADVALGSRFLRYADTQLVPVARRRLLKGAIVVDGLLTGVWLTDAHNGFRAFTHTAASRIHLYENRFAHATEILSQISKLKLRYIEVPTAIVYSDYARAKGQSFWNAFDIMMDVLVRKVLR